MGSPYWRAPEVGSNHYGYPVDVFSFGILLAEIISEAAVFAYLHVCLHVWLRFGCSLTALGLLLALP